MATLRTGYDSMAAWNRSAYDMDINQCRPLKHHSVPTVPTVRRKPVGGARHASVPVSRENSQRSINSIDSPLSPAPLTQRAPTFAEAKSHWSPPPSPRTSLSRTASASSSTQTPSRQDSALSSPPLSPQDQTALAKNLYAASCAGDLKHIRLLLSLGAPINTPTVVPGLYDAFKPAKPGSLSALAGAASHSQLPAARLLLANGAALNPTMKQSSSSPLHQASRADDLEMAAFLLQQGADVNSYNAFKTTPLMYAAKHASPALVYLLLLYRPDIHALSFIHTAAIHWSLWPGNEEVMELLLQAGADPDHAMGDESTPLHCAALSELPKVARTLLRYGADPTRRNGEGRTPLQVAGERGHGVVEGVLREAVEGGG